MIRYLLVSLLLFPGYVFSQNITQVVYFIDGDPGFVSGATTVSGTPVSPSFTYDFTINLSSTSDGFHTLSVRAKDANGNWSMTYTAPFFKISATTLAPQPNLTKVEYFLDGDTNGVGGASNTSVTLSGTSDTEEIFIPLTSVTDGFHTLSMRAQDANGKWSTTYTVPFFKISTVAKPNLTKVEYFLDGDTNGVGAASNTSITLSGTSDTKEIFIPLTSVTDGFHTLSMRAQDANGRWSTTTTQPFYKTPAITTAPNITRLEYFFDADKGPGSGVPENINVPITPGSTILVEEKIIDVSSLSIGSHRISFRALDANNKWSIVYSDTFTVFGPAPAAQPTALTFSNIATTSMNVSFTAANPSPDGGYIAIRKSGSAPTLDPKDGTVYTLGSNVGATAAEGIVAYVGTATTFNDTGLTDGTEYFYKVYAFNGSGTLTNYLTTNPLAGSKSTLELPIQITTQSLPDTFIKGGSLTTNITVNSAAKANGVVLKYKGISEDASTTKSVTVTNNGNKFEITLPSSELTDPIGVRYQFEITDKSSSIVKSEEGIAHVRYTSTSTEHLLPSAAGTKVSDYQIIAVPLDLGSKNSVSSVFSDLGLYDPTQWRLFDYGVTPSGRDNREYQDGFTTIEPGKGYWLIKRNNISIIPPESTSVTVDENNPFTIELVQGWNLIGNPYNFKISWSEVLKASGDPTGIKPNLRIFSGGTLSESAELDRYRGAFIESPGNVTLTIPTLRNKQLNPGRIKTDEPDLQSATWFLPITLSNGELTNEIGGIGMHTKALLTSNDDFDRYSTPMLKGINMPELSFPSDSKQNVVRDVIPPHENFTWSAEVVQSGDQELTCTWPAAKNKGDQELVMLDLATQRLVDMTKETHITLTKDSKSLRIIFGNHSYVMKVLEKELPAIGNPYPNPANKEVKIPFFISEALHNSNVTIRVYNSLGKEVALLTDDYYPQGYHQLLWNQTEPAGMYILSMKVGSGKEHISKLIIQ